MAFSVSESSLKRHKRAGHCAEAERTAASTAASGRETDERVREIDAKLAGLSFGGDLRQQCEALRDHAVALLRRSEAAGDTRGAIAAGGLIEKALSTLAQMATQEGAEAASSTPKILFYPAGQEPPAWLKGQFGSTTFWLPDNRRGDSAASHLFQDGAVEEEFEEEPEELSTGARLPDDADLAG